MPFRFTKGAFIGTFLVIRHRVFSMRSLESPSAYKGSIDSCIYELARFSG